MFNLRIRGPHGATTIQISPSATRDELFELISAEVKIPKEDLEVRFGFPRPHLILPSESATTVALLGIKDGESLQTSCRIKKPSVDRSQAPGTPSTPIGKQSLDTHLPCAPSKPNLPSATTDSDEVASSPSVSRNQAEASSSCPVFASVAVDAGHLLLRVVPDDNSCLFNAVGLLLDYGNQYESDVATKLRRTVAEAVTEDPLTWCEPILGQEPHVYTSKILNKNAWGGAIELAILSAHYRTEICSIDVQSGRVDRFGESENYPNRIFLVYSGIHYDALTVSPISPEEVPISSEFPPELGFDMRIFGSHEDDILEAALVLVGQLREKHYYTDTAAFTLRCEQCRTALVGEKDARQHAQLTGHTDFGEYF